MDGDFTAALPAASVPWQPAHFALKSFSPLAASCARAINTDPQNIATNAAHNQAFFMFMLLFYYTRHEQAVPCVKSNVRFVLRLFMTISCARLSIKKRSELTA